MFFYARHQDFRFEYLHQHQLLQHSQYLRLEQPRNLLRYRIKRPSLKFLNIFQHPFAKNLQIGRIGRYLTDILIISTRYIDRFLTAGHLADLQRRIFQQDGKKLLITLT